MSATANEKKIADAEQKLATLLREINDDPIRPRVQLWIERMAGGRKLSEYLRDPVFPAKERIATAEGLVEILLTKNYDRLPPADSPEAKQPSEPPAPDELREAVAVEVSRQLADVLEKIVRALRGGASQ